MPRPNLGPSLWNDPESGIWHARTFTKGRRAVRSLRTKDLAVAEARLRTFIKTHPKPGGRSWDECRDRIVNAMYYQAKHRAAHRKMDFSLTRQELEDLIAASNGRCSLTGVPFDITHVRGPWVPSIDRINSRLGYVSGNVRIVCFAANLAMSNWGDDVLFTMMESMCQQGRITRRLMVA